MLEYDFDSNLGHWIGMTNRYWRRTLSSEIAPHGISLRQCQILAWLAFEGELSQVALAERMLIEPSTLVTALDRMERDELITRVPCQRDRRKKLVRPTRKATRLWRKIVASLERVRERASRGLTSEQLATLRELLEMVQANLADPAPSETEE